MLELLKYNDVNWDLPYLLSDSNNISLKFCYRSQIVTNKIPFKYLHGAFHCKWNGEELELPEYYPVEFPNIIKRNLVQPIGTFSSYSLKEEDLRDKTSNAILEAFIDAQGEIEISSDILYNYIKKCYPNTKLIASYVKSVYEMEEGKEVEFYNKLLDKFDKVILSPQYVKEKFFKEYEKFSDISRLEIIVNERCIKNCPCIKECFNAVENESLYIECPKNNKSIRDLYDNSLALTTNEVDFLVNEIGIKFLRIKGRASKKEDMRFNILNYMLTKYGVSTFFMYYS